MFGIRKSKYTEWCGWYGMLALISAYGLASFSVIAANGLVFLLLNITGAIGIIIVSAADRVEQSVILNIFCLIIGLIALINALF